MTTVRRLLAHEQAAWAGACVLSWLVCAPLLGPFLALAGAALASLVFSDVLPLLAAVLTRRARRSLRVAWSWRRLRRPAPLVALAFVLFVVGLSAWLLPQVLPAPFGLLLLVPCVLSVVCFGYTLGLHVEGAEHAEQDAATARQPTATPERLVAAVALATAAALGGCVWWLSTRTLPLAFGESDPGAVPSASLHLLNWLDAQFHGAVFGPAYGQWYWSLLIAGAGLLAGGLSTALREVSARLATQRDPYRAAAEAEEPGGAGRVFLSYARADAQFARRLVARLDERLGEVWVDWQGIKPSAQWRESIAEAIRGSDAVVVLVSAAALRSRNCAEECAAALSLGKRILPILIDPALGEDGVTAALRAADWDELAAYQRLEMTAPEEFTAGCDAVVAFVGQEHAWVARHTRLSEQAYEWRESGHSDGFLLSPHQARLARGWLQHAPTDPAFRGEVTPLQRQLIERSSAAVRRRGRRNAVVATAVCGALAVLASLVLVVQVDSAQDRREALSRSLATASAATPFPGMRSSLLLSAAAYETSPTPQAQSRMARLLQTFEGARRTLDTGERGRTERSFSRDGTTLAVSVVRTGRTTVWNTTDWSVRSRFRGVLPGALGSVGLTADGRQALVLADGAVLVRDTASGRIRDHFQLPANGAELGAWHGVLARNGALALVAGRQSVLVRDVKRGRNVATRRCRVPQLSPTGAYLWCAAQQPKRLHRARDGRAAPPVAHDPNLVGWTAQDEPVVNDRGSARVLPNEPGRRPWTPHAGKAVGAVDEDGRHVLLVPGGTERPAEGEVWDVRKRSKVGAVDAGWLRKRDLSLGARDGDDRLAELTSAPRVHGMRLVATDEGVQSLAQATEIRHNRSGSRAVSENAEGQLVGWELGTGGGLVSRTRASSEAHAGAAALSPDGRTMATAHADTVRLRAVADGSTRRVLRVRGTADNLAFSRDGRLLAVSQRVPTGQKRGAEPEQRTVVELFALPTGKRRAVLRSASLPHPQITTAGLFFSPDRRRLFVAETHAGVVVEWNLTTGRAVRRLESGDGYLDSATMSADGRTLATGYRDGTVRLWSTAGGKPLWKAPQGGSLVRFSPDGTRLVTAEPREGVIRVWRLSEREQEGPPLRVAAPERQRIRHLALTGDNARLLVDSTDTVDEAGSSSLRLWDVARHARIGPVLADTDSDVWTPPQATPDGDRFVLPVRGHLATVSADPDAWHGALCSLVEQPLGRAEWRTAAPKSRYPQVCSPD